MNVKKNLMRWLLTQIHCFLFLNTTTSWTSVKNTFLYSPIWPESCYVFFLAWSFLYGTWFHRKCSYVTIFGFSKNMNTKYIFYLSTSSAFFLHIQSCTIIQEVWKKFEAIAPLEGAKNQSLHCENTSPGPKIHRLSTSDVLQKKIYPIGCLIPATLFS